MEYTQCIEEVIHKTDGHLSISIFREEKIKNKELTVNYLACVRCTYKSGDGTEREKTICFNADQLFKLSVLAGKACTELNQHKTKDIKK